MTSRFGGMSFIPNSKLAIPVILDNDGEFLARAVQIHQPAALDLLGMGKCERAAAIPAIFGDPLMGDIFRFARGHGREATGQADSGDGEESPPKDDAHLRWLSSANCLRIASISSLSSEM